ncbi:hypothetical protein PGQ11_012543 [Apiospora arundinis]|uniref:Uncharacterized protein n=1 Tax=Apiospora arundinis TaxID=335852 RepID=A0ABR2I2Q7_9PEZI
MSQAVATRIASKFVEHSQITSCIRHLRQRILHERGLPNASPEKPALAMFGCEPASIFVFATDYMKRLANLRAGSSTNTTTPSSLAPEYDEASITRAFDDAVAVSHFGMPIEALGWERRYDKETRTNGWRLEKTTLFLKVRQCPAKDRRWSTYYGPGHAVVIGVLDLARPPFQEFTEARLGEAVGRALLRTVTPSSPTAVGLNYVSFDRQAGALVTGPSWRRWPDVQLGDTAVFSRSNNIATLFMSLNLAGPIPERPLGGFYYGRSDYDPYTPWAKLECSGLALCPPTNLNVHLGHAAYSNLSPEDKERRDRGAVQGFLIEMQSCLARELELSPPEFVNAKTMFLGRGHEGREREQNGSMFYDVNDDDDSIPVVDASSVLHGNFDSWA